MDVLLLMAGAAGVAKVVGRERAAVFFVALAGLLGLGILSALFYGLLQ